MKQWVTTTFGGQCAFDRTHTWKAGVRVFRLQGDDWPRPKLFCAECAARHGAGEDTGAPAEAPVRAFAPLKALASSVRFDSRAAAAGSERGDSGE